MTEGEPDRPAAPVPQAAGARLRAARDAQGLTLAEVGQRTRVPLRHLEAIETGDLAALPSPTYAVGFSRAYARAVGLDDVAVARDVRAELAKVERAPEYVPYETADPDRVPSRGLAIVGLGLALAILILAGLYYGSDLFRPGAPADTAATAAAAPGTTMPPVAAPTRAAPRQVSLAAGEQEVWLRVYDAADTTLYLGTLAPGAKFDVPPDANRPMINVGRPDQLRVTVDGRPVPPLGDGRRAIKDVPVDAAAMAARLSGSPAPEPTRSPAATSDGARAAPRTTRAAPRPARRVLTETQRANLQSAANLPPPRRRER